MDLFHQGPPHHSFWFARPCLFNSEGAGRQGGGGEGAGRGRGVGMRVSQARGWWLNAGAVLYAVSSPNTGSGPEGQSPALPSSLPLFVKLWANLLEPSAGRGGKRNFSAQWPAHGPRGPGAIETERREATGRFMGSNLLPTPAPKAPLPGDSLIIHQPH